MANDNQLLVPLAIQHNVAKRIERYRVGILQVQLDGFPRGDVDRARFSGENGCDLHHIPRQTSAHDGWAGVWIVRWV